MSYRIGTLGALGIGQGADPSTASEAQRRTARMRYSEGQRAFEAGEYAEALRKFNEAWNVVSEPAVLIAIGAAMIKLERYGDARHRFERYLRLAPDGSNAGRARRQLEYIDYVLGERERVAALPEVTKEQIRSGAISPEEAGGGPVRRPPPQPPTRPPRDPYEESTTIGVWVVTGVGVAGLIGLGWWLTRRR